MSAAAATAAIVTVGVVAAGVAIVAAGMASANGESFGNGAIGNAFNDIGKAVGGLISDVGNALGVIGGLVFKTGARVWGKSKKDAFNKAQARGGGKKPRWHPGGYNKKGEWIPRHFHPGVQMGSPFFHDHYFYGIIFLILINLFNKNKRSS